MHKMTASAARYASSMPLTPALSPARGEGSPLLWERGEGGEKEGDIPTPVSVPG